MRIREKILSSDNLLADMQLDVLYSHLERLAKNIERGGGGGKAEYIKGDR